jgi:hypothetical protein
MAAISASATREAGTLETVAAGAHDPTLTRAARPVIGSIRTLSALNLALAREYAAQYASIGTLVDESGAPIGGFVDGTIGSADESGSPLYSYDAPALNDNSSLPDPGDFTTQALAVDRVVLVSVTVTANAVAAPGLEPPVSQTWILARRDAFNAVAADYQ